MLLKHVLYVSFCGLFFLLLLQSKLFTPASCCHIQYFGTILLHKEMVVWLAVKEWHVQAWFSLLETAAWQ